MCNPLHFLFHPLVLSPLTPPQQTKRDLVTLDVDPSVNVDLLNDLCIGIAVCNPVNVNSDNNENNSQ
jgi:hypothetical protein